MHGTVPLCTLIGIQPNWSRVNQLYEKFSRVALGTFFAWWRCSIMTKTSVTPDWQTAIVILSATVVGVAALAWLYWAQAVCIPVALAVFLSFVLSPLVATLQRWGLGRPLSILLPVIAVTLALVAVAWMVGAQGKALATEAPKYAENIRVKIRSLRTLGDGVLTRQLSSMARQITDELDSPPADENGVTKHDAIKSHQVLVQPGMPSWLAFVPALLGRLVEALGGLVMALVLLIFMLVKREDLRNRVIRLLGHGRLTTTTKVLDDASQRISRYLLMQLVVNGIFGLTLSIGLLVIGLPYAFLWGISAFVLRYVPYIGVWVAALPPVLLSLAVFEGWTRPLLVLGLFLAIEIITGNLVEPRIYGRSVGVSEVALLVAAAFGAFLWGPIGIILSSPLVVCLVVMGKYVPLLHFLDIMLGDAPALSNDVAYYQRLLAHNPEEAREIFASRVSESSLQHACDEILVPALTRFKRDRNRDELTESNAQFVLETTAEILNSDGPKASSEATAGIDSEAATSKVRILACSANGEAGRLALLMLRRLLDSAKWDIEILPVGTLASELIARIEGHPPGLVCIGAVPPGGLVRARYLCKRLKAQYPDIKLVVGLWGLKHGFHAKRERLRQVGVHFVAATLAETRSQLRSLLPLLAYQNKRRHDSTAESAIEAR
jgi:predicted PurR-regulated permease PerM